MTGEITPPCLTPGTEVITGKQCTIPVDNSLGIHIPACRQDNNIYRDRFFHQLQKQSEMVNTIKCLSPIKRANIDSRLAIDKIINS